MAFESKLFKGRFWVEEKDRKTKYYKEYSDREYSEYLMKTENLSKDVAWSVINYIRKYDLLNEYVLYYNTSGPLTFYMCELNNTEPRHMYAYFKDIYDYPGIEKFIDEFRMIFYHNYEQRDTVIKEALNVYPNSKYFRLYFNDL